ncbi:hypothetical protein INR49_020907 [Caranx melampygus]|nr:hypothetical protein INR49_020907 [Caranx melampygus]
MAAQLVIALLALTSLGAASEPDCKELVKPLVLDSHSPIYGKWVLHVGSWDEPALKNDLVTVNSSWVEISASSDSGVITIYWADRLHDDKCLQGVANATVSGITTHTTCMYLDTLTLNLWKSRTGSLEPSELETFKKQAECLKFLPEYHFAGSNLCADERETSSSAAAENTENDQTEAEPAAK